MTGKSFFSDGGIIAVIAVAAVLLAVCFIID